MQKGPEQLPLGIVPETVPIQSLDIFPEPYPVEGVLGLFLVKAVPDNYPIYKNEPPHQKNSRQNKNKSFPKKRELQYGSIIKLLKD